MNTIEIRQATINDKASAVDSDYRLDKDEHIKLNREEKITKAILDDDCFLISANDREVGFVIFDYRFFDQGWIELIIIDEKYRGKGIGRKVFNLICEQCKSDKVFTSTNRSNYKMQRALEKANFSFAGELKGLDEESNSTYTYDGDGTSFAAPHVVGVAALLHSHHHINNGYDNNLAPEDHQEIINQYARDVMAPGYDQFSGNGIVDAQNSLSRVTLPQFHVKHGGGQNQMTTTMDIQGELINVTSQPNISAGAYFANRYKVQNSWLYTLEDTQLPIDVWRRHNSSIGVYDFDPVTGIPYFDIGVTYYNEPNQNQVFVSSTTYCWQIVGNILGQQFNIWIPAHPSQLRTDFSIHVQDNIVANSSDIVGEQFFNVYPNPTAGDLTVDFSGFNENSVEIEFIDPLGRIVHAKNLSTNGATRTIQTFNLKGLASGIYLCTLKAGDQTLTKKFFKQN